jgi:molecular chaperone GrpE (heat shock protein)
MSTSEQNEDISFEEEQYVDLLSPLLTKTGTPRSDDLLSDESYPDKPEVPVAVNKPSSYRLDLLSDDLGKTRNEILCAIDELSMQLRELNRSLGERIKINDRERKIAGDMHEELQKHRQGVYSLLMKPIILDVIEMRESILRTLATYMEKPEGERSVPCDTFSTYSDDARVILERRGIEVYRSEPGSEFIPARHKPLRRSVTDDPAKDKKIEMSLGCGYLWDGAPISPEKVVVFIYESTQTPSEQAF